MPERPPTHRPFTRTVEARANSNARGYDEAWRALRLTIIKRDKWTCGACGRDDLWKKKDAGGPGAHVDHIVPKAKGGTDAPHNLRTLCWPCHSSKTATNDGGFGRRKGNT